VYYDRTAGVAREFEQWMYRVRGQMARAWFCGWLPSVEQEVAKLSLNPELVKRIRAVNDSVLILEKLAQEGRQYAHELFQTMKKNRQGYLMSVEERESIEAQGKKILELGASPSESGRKFSQSPKSAKLEIESMKSCFLSDSSQFFTR
jgi:hypothetical protein